MVVANEKQNKISEEKYVLVSAILRELGKIERAGH